MKRIIYNKHEFITIFTLNELTVQIKRKLFKISFYLIYL